MQGQGESVGPSPSGGQPQRQTDPWAAAKGLQTLLAQTTLPEAYAAPLRRFHELAAVVDWGAVGYEPGSLEAAARALQALPVHQELGVNLLLLKALLDGAEDLLIQVLQGPEGKTILLLGVEGLVDTNRMEDHILQPLIKAAAAQSTQAAAQTPLPAWLEQQGLSATGARGIQKLGEGVSALFEGALLLLVDSFAEGATIALQGWNQRSVSESTTEPVIHGAKEAFTESLRTMTAMVRRRVRTPLLRVERYRIGALSPNSVDLLYIQGLTSPDLVQEARDRLSRLIVDTLHSGAMLEELIEDEPYSLFPQFVTTERPDRVAAALIEGQIAFLVDGNQNAKIAPVSFTHFLTSSDDYEERFWYGTFILWVRFIFLLLITFVPSIYVSIVSLHPEMLPTRIFLAFAAARTSIPFPTMIEVLIMELFFEGMREATALMPKNVGSAVTVVGALVIGEGATRAGFASPATVVIVALTGIASYTIPSYTLLTGLRICRFVLLFISGIFGMFGVLSGLLMLLIHLAALRSFGRPYLQPVAPFSLKEIRDALVRAPFWMMDDRPAGNRPLNRRRRKQWLRPGPDR